MPKKNILYVSDDGDSSYDEKEEPQTEGGLCQKEVITSAPEKKKAAPASDELQSPVPVPVPAPVPAPALTQALYPCPYCGREFKKKAYMEKHTPGCRAFIQEELEQLKRIRAADKKLVAKAKRHEHYEEKKKRIEAERDVVIVKKKRGPKPRPKVIIESESELSSESESESEPEVVVQPKPTRPKRKPPAAPAPLQIRYFG